MNEIVEWEKIKPQFVDGSLLIGNGGSIAVAPQFSYSNLYKYASENELIKDNVKEIFDKFGSSQRDFERVLYRLWQADYINERFEIIEDERKKIRKGYTSVRRSLIDSVKNIHPPYLDITTEVDNIGQYISDFKTVYCLNYDLILYWAINKVNIAEKNRIKDGFNKLVSHHQDQKTKTFAFDDEIDKLRRPYGANKQSTLTFYPHGCLNIYQTKATKEEKKIAAEEGSDLIKSITEFWARNDGNPLFVCEGISESKLKSINSSTYLSFVFLALLPKGEGPLTIYGWSMGNQDSHILTQLGLGNHERVAISIFTQDKSQIDIDKEIKYFREQINKYTRIKEIMFFNSSSPGCWKYPRMQA